MKSNKVTMARLKKLADKINTFMCCNECGAEYSANPSDYWHLPDNHIFKCCRKPVTLMHKRSTYEVVS